MAKKMSDEKLVVPGAAFLRAMDKYASRGGTIAKGSKEYKARLNFAADGIKAAVQQQKSARADVRMTPRGVAGAKAKPKAGMPSSSMSPGAGGSRSKPMDEQARRRAKAQAAYKAGFNK